MTTTKHNESPMPRLPESKGEGTAAQLSGGETSPDGGAENKPENPPAFPVTGNPECEQYIEGMTLRDYFAAKAMQAVVTSSRNFSSVTDDESAAKRAYDIADAMLTARGKSC